MNTVIRETLKAVGWMFVGALLLVIGWFAFAQFVLLPRIEDGEISKVEGPVAFETGDNQGSDTQPNTRQHYERSIMSHLYTPDAAPARPDDHARARSGGFAADSQAWLEHAVSGHRVVSGSGAMLNFQRYEDDVEPPAITDRAVFEKLTVLLPEAPRGDHGYLRLTENPEIIVFWSRGSPDLKKKQICSGYAKSGEIEFRRVSGRFEAKLSFEIDADGSIQPDGSPCEPFTFQHASEFWTREVARLDQWNGGGWGRVSVLDCMPTP